MPRYTKSGKLTALGDVERSVARGADKRGLTGKRRAAYIYGTANKVGVLRGNKPTAKGLRAAKSKRGK
jgi:hypothetical protein